MLTMAGVRGRVVALPTHRVTLPEVKPLIRTVRCEALFELFLLSPSLPCPTQTPLRSFFYSAVASSLSFPPTRPLFVLSLTGTHPSKEQSSPLVFLAPTVFCLQ